MAGRNFAWVTHAPADYLLVFTEDPNGDHAVVSAQFENDDEAREASRSVEGAAVNGAQVAVYCTLPGEADLVLAHFRAGPAVSSECHRGTISFVAVGNGSATTSEGAAGTGRVVSARIVLSRGGDAPRHYLFDRQCPTCGEFRGKIHVMPGGGVLIDTRQLACRCESIPCRYCEEGRVRRPLSEHFDPERRAGCMPWFGYLVPCGGCQAAARGPRIQMST